MKINVTVVFCVEVPDGTEVQGMSTDVDWTRLNFVSEGKEVPSKVLSQETVSAEEVCD